MRSLCTGVILAGGQNSRFSGKNKAFIEIFGKTILDRILETFSAFFDEVILVTKEPLYYIEKDLLIAADPFPTKSALTGIHSALFYAKNPYVFVTACDTPFLKKEILHVILNEIEEGYDAFIPKTSQGMEPLNAVYSRRCLSAIEHFLLQDKHQIIRVFQKRRVKFIPEKRFRENDPDLISFFNINKPDDLIKASQFLSRMDKSL